MAPGPAADASMQPAGNIWLPVAEAPRQEVEAFIQRARASWLSSGGGTDQADGFPALSQQAYEELRQRWRGWQGTHPALGSRLLQLLTDLRLALKKAGA